MDVILTDHARFEIQRCGIEEVDIVAVINRPQQRIPSLKGRTILQSKYFDKTEGKEMLFKNCWKGISKTIYSDYSL